MGRQNLKNLMRLIEVEVEGSTSPEIEFLDDLKRSIELNDMKNSRKPSTTYKPSSMKCIRNMYYQVTGAEQDKSESVYTLVGICNSGTDIHERIQDAVLHMKDNNIDCEYLDVETYIVEHNLQDIQIVAKSGYETKLYHMTLNMSFLTDGLIRYKGKTYIIEFKTETSRKWLTRDGVDSSHYDQATAYSLAFGIDDVIFVYINRDVLDMKSYLFHVSNDMRKALSEKIQECNQYVSLGKAPPKPTLAKKLCTYCNYKSLCDRS